MNDDRLSLVTARYSTGQRKHDIATNFHRSIVLAACVLGVKSSRPARLEPDIRDRLLLAEQRPSRRRMDIAVLHGEPAQDCQRGIRDSKPLTVDAEVILFDATEDEQSMEVRKIAAGL